MIFLTTVLNICTVAEFDDFCQNSSQYSVAGFANFSCNRYGTVVLNIVTAAGVQAKEKCFTVPCIHLYYNGTKSQEEKATRLPC